MKSPLDSLTKDEQIEGAIKQLKMLSKHNTQIKEMNRALRRIIAAIALENRGIIVIHERSVKLVSHEPTLTIDTDPENHHVRIRVRD